MNVENYILSVKPLDGDIDERITQINLAPVSCFTKKSYKEFYSALRTKYKSYKSFGDCGHEYDCCGCACSECNEISFTPEKTIVVNRIGLNY